MLYALIAARTLIKILELKFLIANYIASLRVFILKSVINRYRVFSNDGVFLLGCAETQGARKPRVRGNPVL
jgi:hypothetical protein